MSVGEWFTLGPWVCGEGNATLLLKNETTLKTHLINQNVTHETQLKLKAAVSIVLALIYPGKSDYRN